jgi:hypothetical protein
MTGLREFIWYAAWLVALVAFALLWITTAATLFKAFRHLIKSKEITLSSFGESVQADKKKTGQGSKFTSLRIRTVSGLIIIISFIVILFLNLGYAT